MDEVPMRISPGLLMAAILLGSSAGTVHGQVMGGPRLGVSVASVGGDDVSDVDSRTSYAVGWHLVFQQGTRWALQPELLYVEKGFTGRFLGVSTELKLGYAELPILVRLDLTDGPAAIPYIVAGPTLGVRVACSASARVGGATLERDCDDERVKRVDVGVAVGGGVRVDMGGLDLLLDARYSLGLSEVFEGSSSKNRGFLLAAGLGFPLTR